MAHSIRGRLVYILIFDNTIVGTWTNLKQLCEAVGDKETFISYSKLSKEVAEYRRNGVHTPELTFLTKDDKTYTVRVDMLQ